MVFESRGLRLRGDAWGPHDGAPVLLLHGGGQTRGAWDATARALAAVGHQVIAIDLRGHGESDWPHDGDYSFTVFAADVAAVARALPKAPAIVGASLGGIAALIAEARERVARALVLVDIAPRVEAAGVERIIRFMTAHPDGFASLDEAADAVARYLPDRPRRADRSGLSRNLRTGDDGRLRWHWDPRFLAARDRRSDDDELLLREAARSLLIPTLLVRGRRSDLLSPAGVDDFLRLVPHATFVDVADAGHMVAGDQNDAFTAAIVDFLRREIRS